MVSMAASTLGTAKVSWGPLDAMMMGGIKWWVVTRVSRRVAGVSVAKRVVRLCCGRRCDMQYACPSSCLDSCLVVPPLTDCRKDEARERRAGEEVLLPEVVWEVVMFGSDVWRRRRRNGLKQLEAWKESRGVGGRWGAWLSQDFWRCWEVPPRSLLHRGKRRRQAALRTAPPHPGGTAMAFEKGGARARTSRGSLLERPGTLRFAADKQLRQISDSTTR